MTNKKELDFEELEKVTGGTDTNDEKPGFKFNLGDHIERITILGFKKTVQ